jgi:hypothetical protein
MPRCEAVLPNHHTVVQSNGQVRRILSSNCAPTYSQARVAVRTRRNKPKPVEKLWNAGKLADRLPAGAA